MFKFEASSVDLVNDMVKDYLKLKPELADAEDIGKPFRYKFANNAEGVSPENLKTLIKLCTEINDGEYNETSSDTKLILIDALTLISNHVDQHSKETKYKKLSKELKENTVLNFMRAAYKLSQTLVNTLDIEALSTLTPRMQSTLAQTFHYYGKALRYDLSPTHENALPFLKAALNLSNIIKPSDEDIHNYSARTTTYEMPLIYSYRESKNFAEALVISQRQVTEAEKGTDNFPLVQALVQTSQIFTEMGQPDQGLVAAKRAVSITEVSFNKHVLYFNAQEALMKAYKELGETDKAKAVAQHILDRVLADQNCGAKDGHIAAARKMKESTKNTMK